MKKITNLGLAVITVVALFGARQVEHPPPTVQATHSQRDSKQSPVTLYSPKLDPQVQTILAGMQPAAMTTVIVTLAQQADVGAVKGRSRAERQRGVITALRDHASITQRGLRALLETRRSQGRVSRILPFWVFNGLAVTATPDVIRELAAHPDVFSITPDEISIVPVAESVSAAASNPPSPNLTLINAPALWSMGYFGQGVVVANLDTGVDVTHPDLAGRWRGGANSWFDPYGQHPTLPFDASGHGTWTMGVMVGGDAGGIAVGVAPQAKWIAAKIFNDAGGATTSAIHQSYQWLLDPDGDPNTPDAPQVVNNSWAYGSVGCNLEFQQDLQALTAVGILPIFAAGNNGPGNNTSVSPANYPEALAVGAINNTNQLYAYSSRGPSACGEPSTTYPDIVAPGVAIRSTDLYGMYVSSTGTSLAAPHVAGSLALLLSAFPTLTVDLQRSVLISTSVDMGTPGPDNAFGAGRLNVLSAYNSLLNTLPPTTTGAPNATWYVTGTGDLATDGDLISKTGTLRFALSNAVNGDVVSFAQLDPAVDTIDVSSTLSVPDGVAVGQKRYQPCGSPANPLVSIRATGQFVIFSLGTGATLRNIDIGGTAALVDVEAAGANVDICGVGLGYLNSRPDPLSATVFTLSPPVSATLTVSGAGAILHKSYVNGPIIINPTGSDTRIGDVIGGSGDANHGDCPDQGMCEVTLLASDSAAAQRVIVRDSFPRALTGMQGAGILEGGDVITYTNNWAQTPVILGAATLDHFVTVIVTGTANPLSQVDVYYDDLTTITRQSPVTADASGVFTYTGLLGGSALTVTVASTLHNPAYSNRVGSSSQWSIPVQVVESNPGLLHVIWIPSAYR